MSYSFIGYARLIGVCRFYHIHSMVGPITGISVAVDASRLCHLQWLPNNLLYHSMIQYKSTGVRMQQLQKTATYTNSANCIQLHN